MPLIMYDEKPTAKCSRELSTNLKQQYGDDYEKKEETDHRGVLCTVGKIGKSSDMKKYSCPHWDSNTEPLGYFCM